MTRFQNKIALVTGAARGIGRAIALKLAAEGAHIIANDIEEMAVTDSVVAEIRNLGREAFPFQADVTDRAAVRAMFDAAVDQFGRLDIVVSNAAISVRQPVIEADWAGVQRTIEVVQFGTYNVCQLAAQQMVQQELAQQNSASRNRGKIAIIGSIMGEFSAPTSSAYNMSKAALINFTRTLANEMTEHRINVNIVNPGWIDTPGERNFSTEAEIIAAGPAMPWGRLGLSEDIANAVAFLCSDEADYVTGSTLRVDGGYMASLKLPLPVGSL